MNKKNLIIFVVIFLVGILLINFTSAMDASYCCERLKNNGAWCQNAVASECSTGINPFTNENYKKIATACESTSYCQLGTCINSLQGSCMPNTPKIVCTNEGGEWKGAGITDLPECKLGCCFLGNQAAFVTLTECKKLSSENGLETDYRNDIQSGLECIASITSDELGACVFKKDYQRTCLMVSQIDCNEIKKSGNTGEESIEGVDKTTVEFHKGYLCSASQLETICGPRGGTICKNEKVYFLDTCGNPANVYDSSKLNSNNYWTYIQEPSCDDGVGNKNSKTCGACDYFSGSTCKTYGGTVNVKPTYGNSICAGLDCKDGHLHGETWCIENSKTGFKNKSLPGSRYFRLMCYNGEILYEPCSEFRNEICVESEVNGFSNAGCVLNKWEACALISSEEDCENENTGDCKWISGHSILKDANGNSLGFTSEENQTLGSCVPENAPGFDFWNPEGNGAQRCSIASTNCVVTYETDIFISREEFGNWSWAKKKDKCISNCQCIPDGSAEYKNWLNTMNTICSALGDCGIKKNYFGFFGDNKTAVTTEFIKEP